LRSSERSRRFRYDAAIAGGTTQKIAVVTGRWAGSNKVQVLLEDGSYAQVESSSASADDINPGDRVSVRVDANGSAVDWFPYSGEAA
jgi:hypothetical protein